MIRTFLLAACFAMLGAPAFAQTTPDYWFIGISGTNGAGVDTISFVDANTIQGEGDTRRIWIAGYMRNDSEGVEHIEAIMEFECSARRQRSIEATVFLVSGSPVTSNRVGAWSTALPNTPGEWTLNFACGSRDEEQYIQVSNGMPLAESARAMFEIVDRQAGNQSGK